MCVHLPKLLAKQEARIKELEAQVKQLEAYEFALKMVAAGQDNPQQFAKLVLDNPIVK